MAACVNCAAYLTRNSTSEFCSWNCSQEYWAMHVTPNTDTRSIPERVNDMAKKTEVTVTLVDDLTGEEFAEGKGETFQYTFDGVRYELDLSDKNAKAFRTAVQKYVNASRVSTRKTGSTSNAAEVRAWAKDAGVEVSAKGRIPESVLEQYNASKSAPVEESK